MPGNKPGDIQVDKNAAKEKVLTLRKQEKSGICDKTSNCRGCTNLAVAASKGLAAFLNIAVIYDTTSFALVKAL